MIPCQRHLFDIPEDIAYLNCAYMSPLMQSVVDAGRTGLDRKLRPWTITSADFFNREEDFRTVAAKLFHCTADDVAIVPSTSYGLQAAAGNIAVAPGQKILLLEDQFPSNVYSWRRLAEDRGAELVTVARPSDGDWTAGVLDALGPDVALAALPHTHWTTGGLLDVESIGAACRDAGTALVLDLTQSLGVYPFDARKVKPDFAIAATYKWLLGPYSMGAMYVAPKQQHGRPLEENWIIRAGSDDFKGLIGYTTEYQPGARRFDMGERSNFALLPAAIRAIEQLLAWGVQEVSATLGEMNRKIVRAVEPLGLTAVPERLRAPHYLCLSGDVQGPTDLVEMLGRENVHISVRGSSLRVTPHVYNSEDDVDRLLRVLRNAFSV